MMNYQLSEKPKVESWSCIFQHFKLRPKAAGEKLALTRALTLYWLLLSMLQQNFQRAEQLLTLAQAEQEQRKSKSSALALQIKRAASSQKTEKTTSSSIL